MRMMNKLSSGRRVTMVYNSSNHNTYLVLTVEEPDGETVMLALRIKDDTVRASLTGDAEASLWRVFYNLRAFVRRQLLSGHILTPRKLFVGMLAYLSRNVGTHYGHASPTLWRTLGTVLSSVLTGNWYAPETKEVRDTIAAVLACACELHVRQLPLQVAAYCALSPCMAGGCVLPSRL